MTQKHSAQKGFTLIELLVVISIVALLASVVLGALNSSRSYTRDTTRLAQARAIQTAFQLFPGSPGGLPATNVNGGAAYHIICLGSTIGNQVLYGVNCQTSTAVTTGLGKMMAGINTTLATSMNGGVIPTDAYFKVANTLPSPNNQIGKYYIYNSNYTPLTTLAYGDCHTSPSLCPTGAYLSWVAENAKGCGSAVYYGTYGIMSPPTYRCLLRLGDPVL